MEHDGGDGATFVLIPGAGGQAWYWHRVVEEVRRRGHEAVAVGLPAADDAAGLTAYTDAVVAAIGDARPLVVVGQSMGGLTAPLVCVRVPVDLLVLVNAMVPTPGETGGEWWGATTASSRSTSRFVSPGSGSGSPLSSSPAATWSP